MAASNDPVLSRQGGEREDMWAAIFIWVIAFRCIGGMIGFAVGVAISGSLWATAGAVVVGAIIPDLFFRLLSYLKSPKPGDSSV